MMDEISGSRWWFDGASIDFEEEKEKHYWFKVGCGDETIKLVGEREVEREAEEMRHWWWKALR